MNEIITEIITTTRPYVEHPMNIDVTCGDESARHVLTATEDGMVRILLLANSDDGSRYATVTPAEARAIGEGLLVVADEADERQAVLDAAAPVPWPDYLTVAEVKQECADMEARIGRSEKDLGLEGGEAQYTARTACGIDSGADILASRMQRPGALAYHATLRVLTWTCGQCGREQIVESVQCHECGTVR